MSLKGLNVLVTGASMGIGRAIALKLVANAANVILFARSQEKLQALKHEIDEVCAKANTDVKCTCTVVDVRSFDAVNTAVINVVKAVGEIDVLINNAGLALGAPARFDQLKIEDIDTMLGTNIHGMMYMSHAVLNAGGMARRKRGTILNITSTTALEVPPFPGEAVYHSSKAAQEAFTNVLRTELQDSNIKVIALRPGVVATNFHEQRVGYDKKQYDDFMAGFEPLVAEDVARSAIWMLQQDERVSIKALDVVPTAQRTLQVFDRNWEARQKEL